MKTQLEKKSRSTRQRQVILDEVRTMKSHPTASDVYEIVRCKIPSVSMGTIYRNLEYLREQEEIQMLHVPGEQRRFDGNLTSHYHIRCISCGRIDDLENISIKRLENQINRTSDYQILGHRLEFTGICKKCKRGR